MGEVREGFDAHLRRAVALKSLTVPDPSRDLVGRFVREAQVTGQLEHPNVVPVYDLGTDEDGNVFFAMKRIDGRSLEERIAGGALGSLVERLDVFRKVCDAVAFAHSRGVVHSDLKPANVMVGQFGEVLVLDWGVAKLTGVDEPAGGSIDAEEIGATRAGSIIGTPAYMSPEQARGQRRSQDARSDVYSLGALLYALLTGSSPFPQRGAQAKLLAVAAGTFLPPSRRRSGVPRDLEAIVLHAMALDPADRYPSVRALQADVQAWLEGEPVSVARYTTWDRLRRWAGRHRQGLVAGGMVAGVAGAVSLALGGMGLAGHIALLTDARDRALEAEGEAALRYADALVALARVDTDLGQLARAEERLDEAHRAYLDLGMSPRRAEVARAWLAHRHPPALLALEGGERHQLDPEGERLAYHDGGVVRVHALPDGHLVDRLDVGEADAVHPWLTGERALAVVMRGGGVEVWDVGQERRLSTVAGVGPTARAVVAGDLLWLSEKGRGAVAVDWATGEQRSTIPAAEQVGAASADGTRALGFSVPGSLSRLPEAFVLWDVAGAEVQRFGSATRGVVSPGGTAVALHGDGVEVWTASGGFRVPGADLAWFQFASDDRLLVHHQSGLLQEYEVPRGTLLATEQVPGRLRGTASGGRVLLTAVGDRVELRVRQALRRQLPIDTSAVLGAEPMPDQALLVTVGWSGRLRAIEPSTGAVLSSLEIEASGVRDVDLSADGSLAVTADRGGAVRLHDLRAGTSRELPSGDLGLAVAARFVDGGVIGAFEGGSLVEWDLRGGVVRELEAPVQPWDLRVTPDGHRLVLSGRDNADALWVVLDRQTGAVLQRSAEVGPAYDVDLTPDGAHAAVGTHTGTLRWVELATGRQESWPTGAETVGVAVSEGGLVAAVTLAGDLVLRTTAGDELGTFRLREGGQLVGVTFAGEEVVAFDAGGGMLRFDPALASPTLRIGADADVPERGSLELALGRALARAGDADGAATHLRLAAEAGADVPALERIAQLYRAGRIEEARAVLATASDVAPGTLAVWQAALSE